MDSGNSSVNQHSCERQLIFSIINRIQSTKLHVQIHRWTHGRVIEIPGELIGHTIGRLKIPNWAQFMGQYIQPKCSPKWANQTNYSRELLQPLQLKNKASSGCYLVIERLDIVFWKRSSNPTTTFCSNIAIQVSSRPENIALSDIPEFSIFII